MSTLAEKEFVNWINTFDNLTEYEVKLLNILISNFDTLYILGIQGGKRAKELGILIETVGCIQQNILQEYISKTKVNHESVKTISEVVIGPFRGFNSKVTIPLNKRYTFMYGPNGSGKSSFCEGLEYTLLGRISESDAKNISMRNYIRNADSGIGEQPKIYGTLSDGTVCEVTANLDAYRFSFIEKNRIDQFSRISATTPRDQLARISSLLGLDSFNDFVNGFTDNFDERYIRLINNERIKFEKEVEGFEISKERLKEILVKVQNTKENIETIVQSVDNGQYQSVSELKTFLSGGNGLPGVIETLQLIKGEKIEPNHDIKITEKIKVLYQLIYSDVKTLEKLTNELGMLSSEVNFKELYRALESIEKDKSIDKEECPACKTKIAATRLNPFVQAKVELNKMDYLSSLQDEIKNMCIDISKKIRLFNTQLNELNQVKAAINDQSKLIPDFTEFNFTEISKITQWKETFYQEHLMMSDSFEYINLTYEKIKEYNEKLLEKRIIQARAEKELNKYLGIQLKIDEFIVEEKILNKEKIEIENRLALFQTVYQERIKEIDIEEKIIIQNQHFKIAYDNLIKSLKEYRDKLPINLISGLNEKSLIFYNIINEHDPIFERLESLKLPTKQGDKIMVKFIGDSHSYNALQILSEGHIKSLGLCILLAKVVSDNLGFIIFDDIVNAIDDDHRTGIANLLLECEDIKNRQQIITCHGEEFINKLSHKIGTANISKIVSNYQFLPVDSIFERGVKLSIGDSKHYIFRAKDSYTRNNLKDSLSFCRKAVESLCEQLWRKLGKVLSINLTVKMRRPNGKPELASVVDSLIKELKKISKDTDSTLLMNLSLMKEQYNWALLNKGTHEEDEMPEFERADVKKLIELLEEIEHVVLNFKVVIKEQLLTH
jgi:hypothetical protein